jgi:hypothetical protein
MELWELNEGDTFMPDRDSAFEVYRIEELVLDYKSCVSHVVCRAVSFQNQWGEHVATSGNLHNWNPYAHIKVISRKE